MRRTTFLPTAAAVATAVLLLAGCSVSSSDDAPTPATTTTAGDGVPEGADPEIYALVPDDLKKTGVLPIATDASYPPCESLDDSGAMVGFDPDLWNAMATLMGLKPDVTNTSLEGLRPGVQSGRYRMAMECLNDLPERESQVTFVDYMTISEMVMTLETNTGGVTDDPLSLCGLAAGVASGMNYIGIVDDTLNPACQAAGRQPIQLNVYDDQDHVLTSLYSGRDAFTFTSSLEGPIVVEKAPQPLVLHDSLASVLTATYMGIALNVDDTDLQQAVLAAMTALYQDGTYDQVMDTWDVPAGNRIEPGINLATTKPLE